MTRLSFQIRGAATITLSRDQGEAANANDGVQLTQTSTAPPYDTWWKGELWYVASVDNSPFTMLIIGEADELGGCS
jgi:hypothetical protein